jgi:Ca-activated chloride channel family protein
MMSCLKTLSGEAIPLRGVEVVGDVFGGHAHVRVRQRYQNAERKPVEAVYTFPLPSDGTLVGFTMTCDGRTIEGVVKEREEAFRAYDDAVHDGHGAALVEEERPNVFTASVGNLLPGEETLIEISYVQRVQADEGALRVMIPTLVAPRYIPGVAAGARTAGGEADPTDRVPDADRITPKIGEVDYGLKLELTFDLGRELEIDSPSHEIHVVREGTKTRVSLRRSDVALDRDVVVTARGVESGPMKTIALHRDGDDGVVAVTVVPDLGGGKPGRQDVVFVVDTSGSMEGQSIVEARAALRLCLRHLREGDRFNVIRFASDCVSLFDGPRPFTQRMLDEADDWVAALRPNGGTEMLAPLLVAARQAPDGVIVLLTDGQVGNEAEILREVLDKRGAARIYTFGIGTNVSDALLRDLAKRSGGAAEFIHPGERIDEKVVAQFARATARRVTGVTVSWKGVEVGELAPGELPSLVDNEPWVLYGKTRGRGVGEAEIRGKLDGEPFYLAVAVDLDGASAQPLLGKLWASERVRDLKVEGLDGRRAERMKERIVELGVKYGIATPYTSFVAIETRTGDRRAAGYPETRVIPVHAPAGWDMVKRRPDLSGVRMSGAMSYGPPMAAAPGAMPTAARRTMMAPPAEKAAARSKGMIDAVRGFFGGGAPAEPEQQAPQSPMKISLPAMEEQGSVIVSDTLMGNYDPIAALLLTQRASGLWGPEGNDELAAAATAEALVKLLRANVTASHPVYAAQVKKAIDAALALARAVAGKKPKLAELLVTAAWLLAEGKRLRGEVAKQLAGAPDEKRLRARVDELAAAL